MAITVVSSVSGAARNGVDTSGTPIDTTGATLLVAVITSGTDATPTDSKTGNTWTGLTIKTASGISTRIYYCIPAEVGAGHTFSFGTTGYFCTLHVIALAGTKAATPFDKETGATSAGATTLAPGSATPTNNGAVVITGIIAGGASTLVVPTGYTAFGLTNYDGSNYYAGGAGYVIQTTAAATNPSWGSWSSAACAAVLAVFDEEPTGTPGVDPGIVPASVFPSSAMLTSSFPAYNLGSRHGG